MYEVRQREVDEDLGQVPTVHEVARALGKLKNGKAPESSSIHPEMLKVGRKDTNFEEMVWDLVKAVWEEKRVLQEWVNDILIPIPKKATCTTVTSGGV